MRVPVSNFVSKNKYPNAFYAILFTRFDVIYLRFNLIQRYSSINIADSNFLTDKLDVCLSVHSSICVEKETN